MYLKASQLCAALAVLSVPIWGGSWPCACCRIARAGPPNVAGGKASSRLPPVAPAHAAEHDMQMKMSDPYSPPLLPPVGQNYVPPPNVPAPPRDFEALRPGQGPALSLAAVESLACANNPTLVQARAHTQAALGMALQAGLWPNPRLRMTGENLGADGSFAEFIGGTFSQEIVTAHKQQLSRAKYLARTQVAEWVAVEQQYRVINDVRLHFFRTLGWQQIVAIQRELVKTAEDELLTRREQYNVGQANAAEVHRTNAALQQRRLSLLAAENMLRASWQSMTALAGVDMPFGRLDGMIEEGLPMITWDAALNRLIATSPQMQAARSKIEADRMQLQRELVQSVPNIAVQVGSGQDFTSKPGHTVGFAQLAMDVPIWNRNEGTVREARSDLARQGAEIRRVELELRNQLAGIYQRYITALQHAGNYASVVLPEARAAYALELDSYGRDRIRWTDVLAAQRDYYEHRVDYVKQLIELRESEVLLVGYLLNDGLKAPPNPVPPGHINVNPQPR